MSGGAATTPLVPSKDRRASLPHLPGLDGLRGLAVLAVVVYHGEVGVLPGGFLGVDLFFVLSGFLITSLLLAEHRGTGRISLGGFWARRFRRLLPAVLVFLVAVALVSWWWADPTVLGRIRDGSLAALAYVANWWMIGSGQHYGDLFSVPSPVTHLWSLSVEEQYYVLWPVVVTAVLGRRAAAGGPDATSRRRALLGLAVAGIVVSTAWMVVLRALGSSVDRRYLGTDTRVATILVGVVLAVLLEPRLAATNAPANAPVDAEADAEAEGRPRTAGPRWALAALAVGGAVLATAMATTDHSATWLHLGGFTTMAVAGGLAVSAVVVHPGIDRALGHPVLRWLGTRSYGIYLWHWLAHTVVVWRSPSLGAWPRLGIVALATAATAELSFRLVERPIRAGRVRVPLARVAVPTALAGVAVLLVVSTRGATELPVYLQAREPDDVVVVEPETPDAPSTTALATTAPPTTAAAAPGPTETAPGQPVPPADTPTTAPPTTAPPMAVPTRVVLVGDSIAASIAEELGRVLGRRGLAYADSAFPGCGIITGDPADPAGVPFDITKPCGRSIPDVQRRAVSKARPDLVVAMSGWELRDRVVDGTWHPWGTTESDETILGLLRQSTDRLTIGGARLALVTLPDPVDSGIGPANPDTIARQRHLNELLAEAVRRDPWRVSLVRLDDLVCPTDPCPTVVDGIALRERDGTHFDTPASARWVAERLADRLLAVPAGSRRS